MERRKSENPDNTLPEPYEKPASTEEAETEIHSGEERIDKLFLVDDQSDNESVAHRTVKRKSASTLRSNQLLNRQSVKFEVLSEEEELVLFGIIRNSSSTAADIKLAEQRLVLHLLHLIIPLAERVRPLGYVVERLAV